MCSAALERSESKKIWISEAATDVMPQRVSRSHANINSDNKHRVLG
jgi:hypothetical protein